MSLRSLMKNCPSKRLQQERLHHLSAGQTFDGRNLQFAISADLDRSDPLGFGHEVVPTHRNRDEHNESTRCKHRGDQECSQSVGDDHCGGEQTFGNVGHRARRTRALPGESVGHRTQLVRVEVGNIPIQQIPHVFGLQPNDCVHTQIVD